MSQQQTSAPSPLRFAGIGFEILGPLLVGVFGGRWLDGRLGTSPWLLVAGSVLGAVAGMWSFYRRVIPRGYSGRGGGA